MTKQFNKQERAFIKKYAYGINRQEIINEVFSKDYEAYLTLKNNLKIKLKVDCDVDMILKAYHLQLFDIDDYFIRHEQHIAFGTAYNTYMDMADNSIQCHVSLKELYIKVLRIHVQIIKNYKSNIKSLTG